MVVVSGVNNLQGSLTGIHADIDVQNQKKFNLMVLVTMNKLTVQQMREGFSIPNVLL